MLDFEGNETPENCAINCLQRHAVLEKKVNIFLTMVKIQCGKLEHTKESCPTLNRQAAIDREQE